MTSRWRSDAAHGRRPAGGHTRASAGPVEGDADTVWLAAQLQALFEHDERGRITTRREPARSPAPRFHVGRCRHGNLWRIRADVPPDLARRLSRWAAREAPLPPGPPPWPAPERESVIERALLEAGHEVVRFAGPVLRLPADVASVAAIEARARDAESLAAVPPESRLIEEIRAALPHVADHVAARIPVVVSREGGQVAAVCYTAAGDPRRVAEAGVDTRIEWRRRGHAARAVCGWMVAVRALGGVPLYSTQWRDEASLGVARSLGLVAFADTLHWT